MKTNNKKKRSKLTHDELHKVYEEDVNTVYSPDQINTIGGTMGGVRGTLGSNRGDISASVSDSFDEQDFND